MSSIFLYFASILALNSSYAPCGPTEHLSSSEIREFQRQAAPKRIRISDYPVIGRCKSLVLLVDFNDVRFSTLPDAYSYFNGLLNEEGFRYDNGADGSARDYYLASSAGKFDPDFVVVGPITLPKNRAAYGADDEGWLDLRGHEMVMDACILADSTIDFRDFDLDEDGEVDNVYVFYAGYGQADTMDSDALWPQSNLLYTNKEVDLILDGVRINHYAYSNELRYEGSSKPAMPVGIGTFVHEFGHVLGISDHYDSSLSGARPGVDNWDTMAAANYFNNMHTPPLFSAFERGELGWLDYSNLTEANNGDIVILNPLDESNMAYRVPVAGSSGQEYFILENRRQRGWDTYLPGQGMLVWHIDMDEDAWLSNNVNTDPSHNRVDIVEADGYESINNLAGDPFPGKRNVRQFAFTDWKGNNVFSITDLVEDDEGTISFRFSSTEFTNVNETGRSDVSQTHIYDLIGQPVDSSYHGFVIAVYPDGTSRKYLQ